MSTQAASGFFSLSLLSFLLIARTAPAADVVVSFDDLKPYTPVSEQYLSKGVRFIKSFKGTTVALPTVLATPGTPSAPNAATTRRMPCTGEFCESLVAGEFPGTPRKFVAFTALNTAAAGSAPTNVKLEVFSASQISLGERTAKLKPGEKSVVNFTDAGSTPRIAFFTVSSPGYSARITIDDLTFDAGAGPAVSDFSLVWPTALPVAIAPGDTATTGITLNRFGPALTPIAFTSGSDFPAGVTATYLPNPSKGPSGSTVQVKFSATAAAKPGVFKVTAIGTPAGGSLLAVRTAKIDIVVKDSYDMRVVGVEVTQGTQTMDLPRVGADPSVPVSYKGGGTDSGGKPLDDKGVPLAAGGKTVARVFANLRFAPKVAALGPIEATLQVCDNDGKNCSPEQKSELGARAVSVGGEFVTWSSVAAVGQGDRGSETGAFTFTLPPDRTKGTISLKAKVYPPGGLGIDLEECKAKLCKDNNTFVLKDIPFVKTREVNVWPVDLQVDYVSAPLSRFAFADAINLTPTATGNVYVPEYQGEINITDIAKMDTYPFPGVTVDANLRMAFTMGRLLSRADDWNLYDSSMGWMIMGVFPDSYGGRIRSLYSSRKDCDFLVFDCHQHHGAIGQGPTPGSYVPDRPITSLAHEYFHYLGRPHASGACGAAKGEPWPPDEQGFLQSIGLDRRGGVWRALSSGAPYRIIPHSPLTGVLTFDLMSYCGPIGGGDPGHWISARNWRAAIGALGTASPSAADSKKESSRWSAAAKLPYDQLLVRAFLDSSGKRIFLTKVAPFPKIELDPHGASASPYLLQGLSANGSVVATSRLVLWEGQSAQGAESEIYVGQIPSAQVERVEITDGNAVLTGRTRPAGKLAVELLEPTPNSPLLDPQTGKLKVRWRSGGTQGTDVTAVPVVKVDYSPKGVAPWRPVYEGPDSGAALVSLAKFPRADGCGKLRVRVNDGFNEAETFSECLPFPGAGPDVNLLNPAPRTVFSDGSRILFQGQAYDDRGKAIAANRMAWNFLGAVTAGKELFADTAQLPLDRISRAMLIATDYAGREGRRIVSIECRPFQTPAGMKKRCEIVCENTPERDPVCNLARPR